MASGACFSGGSHGFIVNKKMKNRSIKKRKVHLPLTELINILFL